MSARIDDNAFNFREIDRWMVELLGVKWLIQLNNSGQNTLQDDALMIRGEKCRY